MHKKAASRLVHIENAYATSKARQERYKEDGEEKYQYFATLDLKTSVVCRKLDKKVFDTEDYAVGTTAPPMHPHCRSTTVAYYGRELDTGMARNPVTGKSEKVDNMSYQEWYDKYVKGNPEAEAREKMWQNRYQDDKQYQRYKSFLGKNAPKTLEEFQRMKYINPRDFERLQRERHTIKSIDGKSWSDTFKQKVKDTYYDFRKEGIELTSHGAERYIKHSTAGKYTKEEVLSCIENDFNYKQPDGRWVKHHDGVAVVYTEDKKEIVNILRKNNPKIDWSKL